MLYNFKFIKECCDEYIIPIIEKLGLDYRVENGWICLKCPFHHGEKFNLKYKNNTFFCFSECKRSYSIIDVVAKVLNISLSDSVKWLCEFIGLDETSDLSQKIINHKIRDNEQVMKKFIEIRKQRNIDHKQGNIFKDNQLVEYDGDFFKEMGISNKTLELFQISRAENGDLSNRIIFPICDEYGNVFSLSGRMENYELIGVPKYRLLKNTKAHETLYGIHLTKDYIKESRTAIVVEGFKSVLYLWENDIRNCCAVIGAACSKEQAKLLLKYANRVIVCGDNDQAGRAMEQSVYNRLYRFVDVKILNIGEFTDKEKASVDDLNFEEFMEFQEAIREMILNK